MKIRMALPQSARAGRSGIPISLTLATGIGTLLTVAVLTVLGIGLWSARTNTLALLSDQATLAISSSITQIRQHLAPAAQQSEAIAAMIEGGKIDLDNRAQVTGVLYGALATAPQIKGLVFIDNVFQLFGASRATGVLATYTADYSKDAAVRDAIESVRHRKKAQWGPPVWRATYKTTLLNLRQPVRRDGRFLGMLVALVSISELSENLAGLADALGENAYILYDRTHVLAHRRLAGGYHDLSEDSPLPAVVGFDDKVLASIQRLDLRHPFDLPLPADLKGFVLDVAGTRHIFILRDLAGFGEKAWQVGTYFRAEDVSEQLNRLRWAAIAGVIALVVSILVALIMASRIARPIVRLSQSARRISELDISNVENLPTSLFRELNDQAHAFNTMLAGLRWFEIYVPKTLVRRLVGRTDGESVASTEREITVLFTDIAGFTTLAEGTDATTVADFLNHHFALVASEVEAEDGTVDKFIGDAVMAFWGAPDIQDDHAQRACRAACRIADAIRADNVSRATAGLPEVVIRIGIHTGPAVVGNIGAPGRMNYTIVGDTVNVAQRLEQLGKRFAGDHTAAEILISGDTAAALGSGFTTEPAGEFQVKGRRDVISVYRLRVAG